MKLEEVTAELRPRSDWESLDLGLALVRRDFGALSAAWWVGMLPVLLLLPFLWEHPFWFCFVFWWWIPVGSRLVLFRLSRILFGDHPGWRALWREFPRAIGRRFWFRMLWARISPWRPLTGPVEDLEGLRGKAYAQRCRVLMRRGDSSVILLAMWRLFLTAWLAVTLFCTGLLFIPEHVGSGWHDVMALWFDGEHVPPPPGFSLVVMLSLCLSMWLVDLFSTGCGFGVYVNHRTWIEGWDVELAFRRLGNRLSGIAGLLAAGWLLGFGVAHPVRAENPQQVIEGVLEDPDFKVHEETQKNWDINWDWWPEWGSGGGGIMEALVVLMKIGVFGGLAALLVWLLYRYRHLFAGRGGGGAAVSTQAARVVMGMEVTPESLPDDVAASALQAWREGRRHEAMSLLYRGAISWMIRHGGVEIAESDTENDCLGRIRRAEAGHVEYFGELTTEWVRLAYARQMPDDRQVESLCGRWPFVERGAS